MSTIAVLRADQHMLRIQVSGAAGDNDYTQASLIAACAPGPLKDLFTNPLAEPPPGSGVASWAALYTDARLSVTVTPGSSAASAGVGGFRFLGSPNVFRMTLTSGACVFELRYQPTAVR